MSPAKQLQASTYQSGWHQPGSTPWRCTGTYEQPNGRVLVCTHPVHDEPAPAPAPVAEVVLVTPTAYELSPAEPETDEWFAQRRSGITATDLPKILGLSSYGNALSVWLDKRGDLPPDEAGEAAHWGHVLEPLIAQEYCRRKELETDRLHGVQHVGTLAHAHQSWMRASLDRLVFGARPDADEDEWGALEVKNRNAYVASTWREGVPDDVLAQVVWQLLVTGLPWCDVAVLLGGNRLVIHRVTLDDPGMSDVADLCRREAERVWGHVQDGTAPHVDADEVLLDLLHRLYPDRTGQRELDPERSVRARFLLGRMADLKIAAQLTKDELTAVKAELVHLLDDADTAIADDGNELFTYRLTHRAGYTAAPTTYRQLKTPRRNS